MGGVGVPQWADLKKNSSFTLVLTNTHPWCAHTTPGGASHVSRVWMHSLELSNTVTLPLPRERWPDSLGLMQGVRPGEKLEEMGMKVSPQVLGTQ